MELRDSSSTDRAGAAEIDPAVDGREWRDSLFHGHDREYAYEVVDGIIYQEVPSPSMTGFGFNLYSENNRTRSRSSELGHLLRPCHPIKIWRRVFCRIR